MTARLVLALILAGTAGGSLFGDAVVDRQIENAAARSVVLRDRLAGKVTVSADNGIATLRGRVDTPDQRVQAETAVDLIPDVDGIDDQVRIGGPAISRSDGWILLHLKAELLMRRDVSMTGTDVAVHDGEVILSGEAPSTAQKELTEHYAYGVQGVVAVLNDMSVRNAPFHVAPAATFAGDEPGPRHNWDDPSITAQVRYELLQLRIHIGVRLHVTTQHGIVTLKGRAFNEDEKELIAQAATTAPGVRQVVDLLTVRGQ